MGGFGVRALMWQRASWVRVAHDADTLRSADFYRAPNRWNYTEHRWNCTENRWNYTEYSWNYTEHRWNYTEHRWNYTELRWNQAEHDETKPGCPAGKSCGTLTLVVSLELSGDTSLVAVGFCLDLIRVYTWVSSGGCGKEGTEL
jgi:hypothetical protein